MMNQKLKKYLQYAFSVMLTVLFLYFAFRGTDFENLISILSRANYWWALAMLPPFVISNLFRAWRWEYLLRPVKRGIRFRNLFSSMMVGYMMNNVLPRVGELTRPYAIGKLEGVSRSAALGTVFIERIFDILSFMVVLGLIPLFYSGPLTQIFPWLEETGMWLTMISLLFLVLFTYLMLNRQIVERLLGFFTKRLPEKKGKLVEHIAHSFLDGFLFLKEPKLYFMIGFLSVCVWFFYIVMVYIPFYAFGMVEQYSLDFGSALVVQAISTVGFILPTPGGTGTYHYFTIQTLTKLYNVNEEVARSYATVTHVIGFLGTMIIGIYYFVKDKLHFGEVAKSDLSVSNSDAK